ncbi:MAG: peptidylprolyl isomerase, partial [Bdellovibrionales bacterium]
QTRQLPVDQLFPLALEQVINANILADKTKGVKLDNDPAVKQQLEAAKEQIVRTVYLQKQVEKELTEDRLKQGYEAYVKAFPKVEETKAAHILVDDESLAKKLIKELDNGADFAELAKENSKDNTAANGGDLGYFAKNEVVPEFAEAAFELEPGTYGKKPVKSEFGYHVVKVEDRRMRQPADFEQAKPILEAQLRNAVLNEIVQGWRSKADIERYDINGDAIEPASGEEAVAPETPEEKPAE